MPVPNPSPDAESLSIPRPRPAADERGLPTHGCSTRQARDPGSPLFDLAVELLDRARDCERPHRRYVTAHLAAARAAAALLPAHSRRPPRGRPTSVWALLARTAPRMRAWTHYFAGLTDRRAEIESGMREADPAEADALLRHSSQFVEIVRNELAGATR